MKINSVHIASFGKLKNLTLDFSDGFNVISGQNERGKTTLMTFIKMMFYGSERGGSSLAKNIRKKYLPWDGSRMAGSIDFEHNSKHYRLEKEFFASNSTDKTILCDLDYGTRTPVSSDIGTSFFGLSLSAFERSVFIGQFGYPDNDVATEGEFASKLSNITLTGDQSVSFESVNGRILKARHLILSKTGKSGEYPKNAAELELLIKRLEQSQALLKGYSEQKEEIARLEKEILELRQEASLLKQKIDAEQDIKNTAKLKRMLELKNKLDILNESLKLSNGEILDELYLKKLEFYISAFNLASNKTAQKQNEIELLNRSIDAAMGPDNNTSADNVKILENEIADLKQSGINEKISVCQNKILKLKANQQNKSIALPILLISSFIALFIGTACAFLKSFTVMAITFIVSAFLLGSCLAVALWAKSKSNKTSFEILFLEKELEGLKAEQEKNGKAIFEKSLKLEAIKNALSGNKESLSKQQELLLETKTELEKLNEAKLEQEIALREHFSKYRAVFGVEEILSQIDFMTNKVSEQKNITTELNFLIKDLNNISFAEAEQKLALANQNQNEQNEDFEILKQRYENTLNEISEKTSQIAALSAQTKIALQSAENPEILKRKIEILSKTVQNQKEFCDIADIASSVLTESSAELHKSYGSALDQEALTILNSLSSGDYTRINILKSFDITVEKQNVFGGKEIDYLSSGTTDQIYLSLRLALSKLICAEGEPLPILLDDSLAQYDDERLKKAIAFLKDYSKNNQVIIFTCHEQIADLAKQSGANTIAL